MPSAWEAGRPIYNRLPEDSEQYRYNPVVEAVTRPWDSMLLDYRNTLALFYQNYLDPQTALPANLDWLAQCVGYTGEYWDTNWTVAQKRSLIANSHTFVWPHKGTLALLEYLLVLFAIAHQVYQPGQFLAGINAAGDALGGDLLEYFILLPLTYLRTSREWQLAERLNRLYMPAWCNSLVCYEQFYAGFTVAGEPVFEGTVA